MSPLWRRLKRPETYLAILGALLLIASLDSIREPEEQLTAKLYVGAVHWYQHTVRASLTSFITCRYEPTCSEYSIEAVRVWGIRRGLVLTVERLLSCRSNVPLGTSDPVPIPE